MNAFNCPPCAVLRRAGTQTTSSTIRVQQTALTCDIADGFSFAPAADQLTCLIGGVYAWRFLSVHQNVHIIGQPDTAQMSFRVNANDIIAVASRTLVLTDVPGIQVGAGLVKLKAGDIIELGLATSNAASAATALAGLMFNLIGLSRGR